MGATTTYLNDLPNDLRMYGDANEPVQPESNGFDVDDSLFDERPSLQNHGDAKVNNWSGVVVYYKGIPVAADEK